MVLQSMRGNDKGKWTSTGKVLVADPQNSRYQIRMDGTNRLALRNRVNIRPIHIQDAERYKLDEVSFNEETRPVEDNYGTSQRSASKDELPQQKTMPDKAQHSIEAEQRQLETPSYSEDGATHKEPMREQTATPPQAAEERHPIPREEEQVKPSKEPEVRKRSTKGQRELDNLRLDLVTDFGPRETRQGQKQ